MRPRKSSLSITLVLVGATALAGCSREPERVMRRDIYTSLEDCRADWSRADDCELRNNVAGTGGTGSSTGYYGPRYYWSSGGYYDTQPRPGSRARGVEHVGGSGIASSSRGRSSSSSSSSVSRGGFGSSGSAHGSSS